MSEIFLKNGNFGQKSKFWSKMEILLKHRNFGQRLKYFSKMEILVKHQNFGQKKIKNFRQTRKFY